MTRAAHIPEALLKPLRVIPDFREEAFVEAHLQPPVTSIRLHRRKAFPSPFAGNGNTEVPWCPEGRYLEQRPVFTLDPAFHAGGYYVQEASSMFPDYLCRRLLAGRNNLRVLDLCAAPGGKSTLLASFLDSLADSSLLVSNEVIRSRVSVLEENMTRWGYANTWVTANDPRSFSKIPGYFDVILVDAPCSGSGLFRKDTAALDEWSEANVAMCSQRQQRILADVWPALKENGLLIYATCSYSPEENEDILDWLGAHFTVEGIKVPVPSGWGIVEACSPARKLPCFRFFPDRLKGEGFFIAALRKLDKTSPVRYPKFRTAHHAAAWKQTRHFLGGRDLSCIPSGNAEYVAILPEHEADRHLIQQHLFLRKTGLLLGMPSAKEWLPAHDLALSTDLSEGVPSIAVDHGQALRFLKKEDISLPQYERGWYLITWQGLALGWVKSLGNRYNNYLPKHWRIRMEL